MFKFRVSSPNKIMNIGCVKMPGQFFSGRSDYFSSGVFITIADFLRILQVSRSAQDIGLLNMYVYIEVPPNSIEFTTYIRCGMPAFIIIFADFRIPLTHGITHFCLRIVSATSAYLQGYLGLEFHFKMHGCIRKYWFREINYQNRFFSL